MSGSPLERLVGFGRYLRTNGLPVGTGRILTFCRAAAVLDPLDRTDVQLAARATLVSRHEDVEALDAAFDRYFGGAEHGLQDAGAHSGASRSTQDPAGKEVGHLSSGWATADRPEETDGETAIPVVASDVDLLRTKDFAELTDDERRAAWAKLRRLSVVTPARPSRRSRPAGAGPRLDLTRTLRRSLRTEGEPFERRWRRPRTRRRPLVLILDVSGSMSAYSRPLIEFAHAAARAGRRVEVFCFGTRLTRITRALRARSPDAALAAVGAAVTDWEGGTRIGDSLKELLDGWSSRSSLRGSVVILVSDGLERGDPELLASQMARLGRLSHRILWLNPLKGSPRYEPLARGMAASLPFVDVFLPGHNLESLEALANALTLV